MAEMQVRIGADVSGALAGLTKMERAVAFFGGGVNRFIPQSVAHFKRLQPAVEGAAGAMGKVPNISNQATQSLVNLSRVAQDVPYGFIGIANNLNPLLESFQRLKASTGTTAGAFKALGSSLMGAGGIGLALGVASSLLVVFGDRLFGGKRAADEANQSLTQLNTTLETQKNRLQAVGDEIDNLLKLSKIGIDINFDKGGDLLFLQGEVVTRGEQLYNVRQQIKELKKLDDEKFNQLQNGAINEKTYNTSISEISKQRTELWTKEIELEQGILVTRRQITLQQKKDRESAIEEQKKANQDAANAYKKYVSEIIAEAKRISEAFKNSIDLKLSIGFFDDIAEQFKKSASFLSNFNAGNFLFTIVPKIEIEPPPEDAKGAATEFGAMFYSELKSYFDNSGPIDFSLLKALQPKIETDADRLGAAFNRSFSDSFISGFESIGESIGNVLSGEGFGSGLIGVISSLLKELGTALIKYGIIKEGIDKIFGAGGFAIPGAVAIGLGIAAIAASSIFKNNLSGRAAGGPVGSGQPYVVGEQGRELFVPSTSGRIIPNNQLGGLSGAASQMVQVMVTGRIRGNDLVLVQARQNKYIGVNV